MSEFAHPRVIVRLREVPEAEGFREPERYLEERDPAGFRRIHASIGDSRLLAGLLGHKSRERLPELQKRAAADGPELPRRPADDVRRRRRTAVGRPRVGPQGVLGLGGRALGPTFRDPGPDPLSTPPTTRARRTRAISTRRRRHRRRLRVDVTGGDGAGSASSTSSRAGPSTTRTSPPTAPPCSRRPRSTARARTARPCSARSAPSTTRSAASASRRTSPACTRSRTTRSTSPDAIIAAVRDPRLRRRAAAGGPGQRLDAGDLRRPDRERRGECDAIRLATALGIIVVEAGGNGTNNGSTRRGRTSTPSRTRSASRSYAQPGERRLPRLRARSSSRPRPRPRRTRGWSTRTHGAAHRLLRLGRERRHACSSTAPARRPSYTDDFSGTSGASPIVTGAALAVQGMCEAQRGYRLSPRQMRAILQRSRRPTPRLQPTETTAIGVMPNLRGDHRRHVLGVAPDVYLRDYRRRHRRPAHRADLGQPGHHPAASAGRRTRRPRSAQGSGTENERHARLRGRGGAGQLHLRPRAQSGRRGRDQRRRRPSTGPRSATLVTPDLWTWSASVDDPERADRRSADGARTRSPGRRPQIPGPGHYCFVGILGTRRRPGAGAGATS